ncbi:MAG: TMEM165/GDT1 family protein [Sciscionella sp.]|nr:TMEM165/GDT1 family protein [Sciscionella sp.]
MEVAMTGGALFLAVFLACTVEAVEALTIVLAAGIGRQWRSAGLGVGAALVVLAVLVAALGPALSVIPIDALRLVVGGLLLIFGLQWLRKAILRASGHKSLHDENAIFQRQLAASRAAPTNKHGIVGDWYAFTLSFKGVLLEGLEVVFIALTFGSNQHNIPLAALAAGCAVVLVAAVGVVVRAPLARVPENSMKFIVGVLLTTFGLFWGGEGAGARWPGSDAALLVIAPAVAVFSIVLTAVLRRVGSQVGSRVAAGAGVTGSTESASTAEMEPR